MTEKQLRTVAEIDLDDSPLGIRIGKRVWTFRASMGSRELVALMAPYRDLSRKLQQAAQGADEAEDPEAALLVSAMEMLGDLLDDPEADRDDWMELDLPPGAFETIISTLIGEYTGRPLGSSADSSPEKKSGGR